MNANEILTQIRANVDSFYANEIDHETFHANQRSLWDEARNAGVSEAVTEMIRKAL